jgi:hypothetical protein
MGSAPRRATVPALRDRFSFNTCAVVFLAAALAPSSLFAEIITRNYGPFTVNFYGVGNSFDNYNGAQAWTEEQMTSVGASIAAWDANIGNTAGRQIKLDVIWTSLGSGILGGSYSTTSNNTTTTLYNNPERIWREGWTGTTIYDTRIVLATGFSWNYGAANPSSGQYDFRSVMTHELGHSLGFDSSYGLGGNDRFGSYLTTWDKHLKDSAGVVPAPNSRGQGGNFNQTDDPVYFVGTFANAANGGNAVEIYAPTTFSEGSSLVHLNTSTYPNALMKHAIAAGTMVRAPSDLEWAMMRDMGWNIVPEPGTLVLLFAAVGVLLIRRRMQA